MALLCSPIPHPPSSLGGPIPRRPSEPNSFSCAWLIFLNHRQSRDTQLLHGSFTYSLLVWTYGHWQRVGHLRRKWGVQTNRWKNRTYSRIWRVSHRLLEGYVMSSSAALTAHFQNHHVSFSGVGVWLSLDALDKCHLCGSVCTTWIEVGRFHAFAQSHHFFASPGLFIRDLHYARENILRNAWIPWCYYWRCSRCLHNCNSMLIRNRARRFYLRRLTPGASYYHADNPHFGSNTPRAGWWLSLFRWYVETPPGCCINRIGLI